MASPPFFPGKKEMLLLFVSFPHIKPRPLLFPLPTRVATDGSHYVVRPCLVCPSRENWWKNKERIQQVDWHSCPSISEAKSGLSRHRLHRKWSMSVRAGIFTLDTIYDRWKKAVYTRWTSCSRPACHCHAQQRHQNRVCSPRRRQSGQL